MDYKKKDSLKKLVDGLVSVTLLILSFVILILPPWRCDIPGYIIIFISALCFAIGYFRTIALIPYPKTKPGRFLYSAAIVIAGLMMQIYGFYYMYIYETERGICLAVVLMIESLAMFLGAFNWDDSAQTNFIIIVCRIAIVLLVIFSIWLLIRDDFSAGSVYVATALIVECLVIGTVAFSGLSLPWKKSENEKEKDE